MPAPLTEKKHERRFPPLLVVARVFDISSDTEIRRREFDYNDQDLRKWYVESLTVWAVTHGYAVELVAIEHDK